MSESTIQKITQWAQEGEHEMWVIECAVNNYLPMPPVGQFGMRSHKRRAFFKLDENGRLPSADKIAEALKNGDYTVVQFFEHQLQWSKEPPKVEGHYWWRDNRDNGTQPSIVYISQLDRDVDGRRKKGTWVWCGHYCTEGTVRQDGWNEWAGPLTCPPFPPAISKA